MPLASVDLLQLNIMLTQNVRAVRIDENRMQVLGLAEGGEARITLNPDGCHATYIKLVREFLSGHIFDSPGGYPIFLDRWTRMGQAKNESLRQLLMLGEPEAVVAVAHAQGLTPELGRRAWWCMPTSENARRMLEHRTVVDSDLGPILADHLYEHLPFETEPEIIIETVRLILQRRLINADKRRRLWRISQRKNSYLVGFMRSLPDELSDARRPHHQHAQFSTLLSNLRHNVYAKLLLWLLSAAGQGYLSAAYTVLKKPADQDVVVYLLNTLHNQIQIPPPHPAYTTPQDIAAIDQMTNQLLDKSSQQFAQANEDWRCFISVCGAQQAEARAMLWLSQIAEPIVNQIFAQTTAVGTLMRKKLAPVTNPIFKYLDCLLEAGD